MSIRIRNLRCNITVKKAGKGGAVHQEERQATPSLQFVQPVAEPEKAVDQSQAQTPQDAGQTLEKPRKSPTKANPRQVADRVYELMKEELVRTRQRSKPW